MAAILKFKMAATMRLRFGRSTSKIDYIGQYSINAKFGAFARKVNDGLTYALD